MRDKLLLGLLIAALAAVPPFLPTTWLQILLYTVWVIFFCTAWNIAVLPGLFSMMHGVFLGIGGYVTILLFLNYGVNPWLGMLIGAAASALLALGVGWVCFRFALPTLSFATFTLAISLIAAFVVASVPLGPTTEGLLLPRKEGDPWLFQFDDNLVYYYIVLAMGIGGVALAKRVIDSRTGTYFRAIHENERWAQANGVNVFYHKLGALALSAALTSLAGTFWAQYTRFVGPDTVGPNLTITVILFAVIGGIGTLLGPIIAPAVLVPLGEVLRMRYADTPGLHLIVTGAIVVVILLTLRMGLVPWFTMRRRRRRPGPLPAPESMEAVAISSD